MATKLGTVVTWGGFQSHENFWLRGHMTNEKNLYLHLHSTYGRLIWKSGNLHCRNPIH